MRTRHCAHAFWIAFELTIQSFSLLIKKRVKCKLQVLRGGCGGATPEFGGGLQALEITCISNCQNNDSLCVVPASPENLLERGKQQHRRSATSEILRLEPRVMMLASSPSHLQCTSKFESHRPPVVFQVTQKQIAWAQILLRKCSQAQKDAPLLKSTCRREPTLGY